MTLPVGVLVAAEAILQASGLFRPEADTDTLGARGHQVLSFPEWDASIRMPKPADTCRVFVLGGSAAMGFGVRKPYAALLQERLRDRFPARHWEVINGGRPGVGSGVVFQALEQACRLDPDLFLVCLGHNEFLEVVFLSPDGIVATIASAGRFCQRSSIVNGARRLLRPMMPDIRLRRQHQLLSRAKFPYIRSARQYRSRLRHLAAKLHDMASYCQDRGIGIAFVPAVPNLLWPPGDSVHGPSYRAGAENWQRLFAQAESEVCRLVHRAEGGSDNADRWADAIEASRDLVQTDAQYAYSHYLLGLAWLHTGQTQRGKKELLLANQCDRRGDRSNTDIIEAVIAVCREREVPVLDVRDRFFSALPQELARYRLDRSRTDLFIDHCHPSQEGHELLADALFDFLSQWYRARVRVRVHGSKERFPDNA